MLNRKLFSVLSLFLAHLKLLALLFFCYSKDIRLSDNPVADPARGGFPRFVLIARLAKVEMLNGSEVNYSSCIEGLPPFYFFMRSN